MFVLHFVEHYANWPSLKYKECFDTEEEARSYAIHYDIIDAMEIFLENFSTHETVCIKPLTASWAMV